MNDLKKYFGIWVLSSIIVLAFNVGVVWMNPDFIERIRELLTTAIIESLPIPFNVIFGWHISPIQASISFIVQLAIFIVLIFLLQSR